MKQIVKLFFVFCTVVLFNTCVYADCEYMVQLSDDAVIPYSMDNMFTLGDSIIYETNEKSARAMLESGYAEYIEPVQPVITFEATYNDAYYTKQKYMSLMNIENLDEDSETLNEVKIGIIDSGIYQEHPDFADTRFGQGYNYVENSTDTTDKYGHGTNVAGIIGATANNGIGIAGIAPAAVIVPYVTVTVDDEGEFIGGSNALVKCIKKAADDGCKVINMSVGIEEESRMLEEAVKYAERKGVIMVSAAGNYGGTETEDIYIYPASYDNVISVGAVNNSLALTYYSQRNDKINTVAAIGSLYSTTKSGGYAFIAGTSFATPVITGIMARIAAKYPDMTAQEAVEAVKAATMDLDDAGRDYTGYGLLMADEIINYVESKNSVFISPISSDTTFNLKVVAKDNVENAVLVRGVYKDNVITACDFKEITFSDDMYAVKTTVSLDTDEEMRIFLTETLENIKSLSAVKKYLQ